MYTLLKLILFALAHFLFSCSSEQARESDEGFITTRDGARLYYQRVGNGPEVVIIPAGMYLANEFSQLASSKRTLVFYDQRGRGRSNGISDRSKLGWDYEISDLESVREHLSCDQMSLIGWSYSGAIVALYAIEHPDIVKRVVQIGPIPPRKSPYWSEFRNTLSSRRDSGDLERIDDIHRRYSRDKNVAEYIREYYEVAHKPLLYDKDTESRFRKDFYSLPNERPDNVWKVVLPRIIESFGEWDWRTRLSEFDVPLLTIHGEYDAIPMRSAREWTQMVPNGRFLVVRKAGHLPWLEQPDIFFRALNSFLDGNWPEKAEGGN